jgi:hypothetical protein
MTVSSLTTKVPYACDGTTVIFPITFGYFEDADIKVVLKNNTTKAETPLILNTDFVIPAVGEEYYGNIILAGDYAITPPTTGYTLLLKRVLPLTQLFDYIEGAEFPAASHEEALDRKTMIEQQLAEMLGRALLLAEASTLASLVLPEKDGEKAYLGWNEAGTALEVKYGGDPGPQGEPGTPGADGVDGADGEDGAAAPEVAIQYSINGSTSWHDTYASGDKYVRFSVDDGVTWTDGMKFIGEDGAGSGDFKSDGTVPMTGDIDLGSKMAKNVQGMFLKAATELTIATGAMTVTQMLHSVDTQSDAASDDLDTINGGTVVSLIILRAENDARSVVLKHNTGNIWNPAQIDITLDDIRDSVMLWWDGTKWIVLSVWIELAEQQVLGRLTSGVKKGLTVAELQTLLLSATFPENTVYELPSSLSADGKYIALRSEPGTLGETMVFGEGMYFKASDGKWWKWKADVTATCGAVRIGYCCVAGNANAATIVMFKGMIRADALFDTFTISAPVFPSAATAGKTVSTAPTGTTGFVVRVSGRASPDGNTIQVDISPDYLELA